MYYIYSLLAFKDVLIANGKMVSKELLNFSNLKRWITSLEQSAVDRRKTVNKTKGNFIVGVTQAYGLPYLEERKNIEISQNEQSLIYV